MIYYWNVLFLPDKWFEDSNVLDDDGWFESDKDGSDDDEVESNVDEWVKPEYMIEDESAGRIYKCRIGLGGTGIAQLGA